MIHATGSKKSLTVFAPAKVNLFLHVTGRKPDDYHTLDSLVCFADIGDSVKIEAADKFSLTITGPFAHQLSDEDRRDDASSTNLVVRAARSLAAVAKKTLNCKIILTKNLPVASGLGGGSSNAAATLWGLQDLWSLPRNAPYLPPLMKTLGADVPACMPCAPLRMRGIGEIIEPIDIPMEIPIVLINPLKPCPTRSVFLNFNGHKKSDLKNIPPLLSLPTLVSFLEKTENDLTQPAISIIPEIGNALSALRLQSCIFARMSGSGATVFGLFADETTAAKSAQAIAADNPDWWVKTGTLNRVERY